MIEEWIANTFRVDNAMIQYTIERDQTVWIYFAYAPTSREFYNLVKCFSNKLPANEYDIILYRTKQPNLFCNHAQQVQGDIYRWKR